VVEESRRPGREGHGEVVQEADSFVRGECTVVVHSIDAVLHTAEMVHRKGSGYIAVAWRMEACSRVECYQGCILMDWGQTEGSQGDQSQVCAEMCQEERPVWNVNVRKR